MLINVLIHDNFLYIFRLAPKQLPRAANLLFFGEVLNRDEGPLLPLITRPTDGVV